MINSVKKAMDILTALSHNGEAPMTLSELSETVGINKSTCAHIVDTMCESLYVERVSRKEGYHLGPWAYMLSRYGSYHSNLIKNSSPVLKWLYKKTNTTVFVAVLCNGRKYIVHHIDEANILPMSDGSMIQGYTATTATGRVLLSYLDAEAFNYAVSRGYADPNYPQFKITEAFKKELNNIRANGFDYLSVEKVQHQSYAFPIYEGSKVVASLGILYPNTMDSDDYKQSIIENGHKAAKEISRRLSFS